jgi:hypothetical protein
MSCGVPHLGNVRRRKDYLNLRINEAFDNHPRAAVQTMASFDDPGTSRERSSQECHACADMRRAYL